MCMYGMLQLAIPLGVDRTAQHSIICQGSRRAHLSCDSHMIVV